MTTTVTPPGPQRATDSWHQELERRRTAHPGPTVIRRPRPTPEDRSRRRFLLGSFWTGVGLTVAGAVGLAADFLYPRNARGFGGPVSGGHVSDLPRGGEPRKFQEGQFLLVNLDPAETRRGGSGGGAGLLALWWKCPHLGCTVPWRSDFEFDGDAGGWYRCPCHASTYTKAGIRVYGPAPRSMDTMAIEIDEAGNIAVQTGEITRGGPDNPERAVDHPLLPT